MKQKLLIFLFLSTTLLGYSQIPTGYYDNATASGYSLKTQLKSIIDNINDENGQAFHDTSVTYGDLWDLYETSDVRNDGKVWDIYSNCNFTFSTDQDRGSGGTTECDKYNREHTFAQSWYGGSNSHPLRGDAHHVFPSDKKVNGIRSNYAFGEVLTADYTSNNGSKRGTSSITGPNDKVFEPINEYKGDIARALFYVSVRYQDEINNWENNNNGADNMLNGTSDKVFEQWALDMLYHWHLEDPVSQKELDRNDEIFKHQKNRNPFVDHPEYVNQIWGAVLSTENFSTINNIKIYPNPTNGNNLFVKTTQNCEVQIYNVIGKLVISECVNASNNTINLSNLNKGVYLIKIISQNKSITKKLIKS
ncbi:T9SS type A sorting domain-containing protein [Polaribacter aestuariivivens]|uniref:T9SS type A sorting domain-containing protein n=1 Tax=Polaribacter aestuariivivens TaxID=2304626 RepID=A0A5S3N832_9FLAO|nr:endonuclease [Polaribacter aestuariivivens]TMM31481.1 T9SS type A sorting domain-containing protein [Polaribacter aestuariivivens]